MALNIHNALHGAGQRWKGSIAQAIPPGWLILCVSLEVEKSDIENTTVWSVNLDVKGQWLFGEPLDKLFWPTLII